MTAEKLGDNFALNADTLGKKTARRLRTGFALGGIAAIVIGAAILFTPEKTLSAVGILLSIYFFVAGAIRIFTGLTSQDMAGGLRALNIVLGLLFVAAGVLTAKNGETTASAVLLFLVIAAGFVWIVEGVITLAEAGRSRSAGWAIAYGALTLIVGISIIAVPVWSLLWFMIYTGIVLIVLGVLGIVRAITFGRPRRASASNTVNP
jgi:uncharacterized membrane protein HdeD (DUF308 family)